MCTRVAVTLTLATHLSMVRLYSAATMMRRVSKPVSGEVAMDSMVCTAWGVSPIKRRCSGCPPAKFCRVPAAHARPSSSPLLLSMPTTLAIMSAVASASPPWLRKEVTLNRAPTACTRAASEKGESAPMTSERIGMPPSAAMTDGFCSFSMLQWYTTLRAASRVACSASALPITARSGPRAAASRTMSRTPGCRRASSASSCSASEPAVAAAVAVSLARTATSSGTGAASSREMSVISAICEVAGKRAHAAGKLRRARSGRLCATSTCRKPSSRPPAP